MVSQIRTTKWSRGRAVLVGDAAHAPSFLTGQGTSPSLAGAYVLAGELAAHTDHGKASAEYKQQMMPFATVNQDVVKADDPVMLPATEQALTARNDMLRSIGDTMPAMHTNPIYNALILKDYPA
jgi:2-polyprenyl-6-methoxyphenol hydroxylase-like FAD-dependent oxidoreductase